MTLVRLQKLLAEAGVGSRRYCETLISGGRVRVNGEVVRTLGFKADRGAVLEVDSRRVTLAERKIYIMLNKPPGVITSAKDPFERKTVLDLVVGAANGARVFPVGRLDYQTRGVLLLTNDGDFAQMAAHPGHTIDKVYEALTDRMPQAGELTRLRQGVTLDDGFRTAPAKVLARAADLPPGITLGAAPGAAVVTITIHEGKNRQVRRMLDAVGVKVLDLKRIAVGGLTLDGLPEGAWRLLSRGEAMRIVERKSVNEP